MLFINSRKGRFSFANKLCLTFWKKKIIVIIHKDTANWNQGNGTKSKHNDKVVNTTKVALDENINKNTTEKAKYLDVISTSGYADFRIRNVR